MDLKKIVTTAAILGAVTFSASTASANDGAFAAFNAHYTNAASCTSCHAGTSKPVTPLSALGNDWKAQGGTADAGPTTAAGWTALDGTYLTAYGPVKSTWTAPVTPPASSGGGCVTSSVTTPLMMVLAMLSLGFFVRRKKG